MPDAPHRIRPALDETAFVAQGAIVAGEVTIGARASVWFNAVLRADCEAVRVGDETNVQDGCVLHADPGFPCVLGRGATIGHRAIVHGATVGDNVTIGMGAIVLNGARVGENSIVAAGAVVTEGAEIPPGSLAMGVPAKVKRPLSEDEIARNRASARHYVAMARRYASGEFG